MFAYVIEAPGGFASKAGLQSIPFSVSLAAAGSSVLIDASGTQTYEIVGFCLTTSVPTQLAFRAGASTYLLGSASAGIHTNAGVPTPWGYIGETGAGEDLTLFNRGAATADIRGNLLVRQLES